MPRLLVFWSRPQHLSAAEAERWARGELRHLLALHAVEHAQLSRLETASARHSRPCDWMLELHLAPGADASACLESPPWRDWFGDLRLLGMRPSVVLADGGAEVHP